MRIITNKIVLSQNFGWNLPPGVNQRNIDGPPPELDFEGSSFQQIYENVDPEDEMESMKEQISQNSDEILTPDQILTLCENEYYKPIEIAETGSDFMTGNKWAEIKYKLQRPFPGAPAEITAKVTLYRG